MAEGLAAQGGRNASKLGILVLRTCTGAPLFLARCWDTAQDGRGFMIPLSDTDVVTLLSMIKQRRRSALDVYLEAIFTRLLN
jgi:hypothetical protein